MGETDFSQVDALSYEQIIIIMIKVFISLELYLF